MSEHMMPGHGSFCWNELGTTNADAAKKFYGELLGWEYRSGDVEGFAYNEIIAGGRPSGGIFKMGPESPGTGTPQWMPYVAVDDVDGAAGRVESLGGKVCVPPTDIPHVGRFCVVSDPTGASISLIKMSAHG